MAVQVLTRGSTVIEMLGALLKPKMAWMLATPFGLVVGFLLVSVFMGIHGAHMTFAQQAPTAPEMERHLETNDKRIDAHDAKFDKVIDLINEKFDRLETGREKLEHDVTYLYGGIGVLGVLLGIGVIKINAGTAGMSRDDLQQLALLARELRNPRGKR